MCVCVCVYVCVCVCVCACVRACVRAYMQVFLGPSGRACMCGTRENYCWYPINNDNNNAHTCMGVDSALMAVNPQMSLK